MKTRSLRSLALKSALMGGLLTAASAASAATPSCPGVPTFNALKNALRAVVAGDNGGFGNHMWATIVNRDGQVCRVVFSGADRRAQWLASRIISAQKANTANGLSLRGLYPNVGVGRSLSTGNLYSLVLPGGSLFGLQESNPVDAAVAYGAPVHLDGDATLYGQPNDPLIGQFIGGINVFGGGLTLYNVNGTQIGAIGVSGDTSCTDHIVAWRVRDALALDNIPGGVGDGGTNDNLILADTPTPNTFEHPTCGFGEDTIIPDLATTDPIGPNP